MYPGSIQPNNMSFFIIGILICFVNTGREGEGWQKPESKDSLEKVQWGKESTFLPFTSVAFFFATDSTGR